MNKKRKKPVFERVDVRDQSEATVLKEIHSRVGEARQILLSCEEQKKIPNKWLLLYATHTASLLGKLRLARREKMSNVPQSALPKRTSKVENS